MTSGRFKPGVSGNPKGRKPGTGAVAELRQGVADHVQAIIRRLVRQAKAGDALAARLLLERVIPPLKAVDVPTPTPMPEGSLTEQGRAIVAAAAAGQISFGQAVQLVSALSAVATLTTTDELAARIAALEERYSNGA